MRLDPLTRDYGTNAQMPDCRLWSMELQVKGSVLSLEKIFARRMLLLQTRIYKLR